MPTELNLSFPDEHHVVVTLNQGAASRALPFSNPLSEKDHADIRWYVETYGAHSLGDPDEKEAHRIAAQLPHWGRALFKAVFADDAVRERLSTFRRKEDDTRLLTISAEHPAILSLPWELIHSPSDNGGFLFLENPRISVRRRVAGADDGREAFTIEPKDSLHLLFIVSRPADTGFLDPRADSQPVLDAIDLHAPGRVTWEFLRPPTLDALLQRLEDKSKTPVDILHFDGHGVFDRHGNLPNRAAAAQTVRIARLEEILRDKKVEVPVDPDCPPNTGYLLFEKPDGTPDFVSAAKLGDNLHRHQVALVILSACQSAAIGSEEKKADGQPDRPMGSVAARLTATGIPSVLAMIHSVLVHTTRTLFGEFYKELARHKGIGEALDLARRYLANHPEKYEVQRGPERMKLKLHDWFLPALYQQGADGPLLKEPRSSRRKEAPSSPSDKSQSLLTSAATIRTNLPKVPEAGFFGRKRKLWEIERWFAGPTRRITITGFGGQGKTALAQEAGRWLTRTGLFQVAVFVDYSRVQAADAVSVAKNEIGKVLDLTLIDAAAATAALKQTPTLVILDNLEALAPDSLRALLDAAVPWSEAGGSRVLCTTRRPDFGHAAYRVEGTNLHRRIQLDGLGSKAAPDDALEWCAALMKLPPAPTVTAPKREALIELFDRVKFHPLSIRVLAQQLKTRRMAELGERLEQLLGSATVPVALTGVLAGQPRAEVAGEDAGHGGRDARAPQDEDTPAGLLASLELSLDRLDEAARRVLPRLGVFQGGAMENQLLDITGLGDEAGSRERIQVMLAALESGDPRQILRAAGLNLPDGVAIPTQALAQLAPDRLRQQAAQFREMLAKLPPSTGANLWPGLRRQLEAAALIEAEDIPGVTVPFLRFHPTLAPMLWARLDAAGRERLTTAHRQRYYALSGYLYQEDKRNPHQARAIAWRELPNLLHAVHAALDAGDPDAGTFANNVNLFLGNFGLKQEAERLSARAQQAAPDAGSRAWILAQSNRGEQLFAAGQVAEAVKVFQAILQQLGDKPTYERAVTLGRLGRCSRAGGRPDLAADNHRKAIAVWKLLEQTDAVKGERSNDLTDLADALAEQGKFAEARKEYEASLVLDGETGQLRNKAATLGQLGTLAMMEGNLAEAADRHRAALALFQQLREPAMEGVAWHQLGRVFQEARQWDEAERHYRESARIKEENGIISGPNGATTTWNQLAIVSEGAGKPDAAEMWYRKGIEVDRALGNPKELAPDLSNLAGLLRTQPGRLAEARQLAEEALAIDKTLDPGAAEIWTTYNLLAEIAEKEAAETSEDRLKAGLQTQARDYRRLAREAKRNFAGTRHELRQHTQLILATVAACAGQAEARELVTKHQAAMRQGGPDWTALAAALDRILAGERDETALCEGLGLNSAMIIETILTGLADPQSLADLLPPQKPEDA